ncbi:sulfotransferase family 2 domain-containing protein [Ruegeria sp. HKCCA5491]|uniref:sulfotransferase family 2 domain-containing protein n=1 Tax=Ruegeria sp. HKCCA5491 TaxID=2682986 RepID=UPI0020C32897|nr:sulfotransferase family 2 domain-containing protein [Ruegeria sp. HKCCA5491]
MVEIFATCQKANRVLHNLITSWKINCECPTCGCPSAGGKGNYTFRYVNPPLVYFDVPKCASSSIRRAFFGPDESMSLRKPPVLALTRTFRFSFVRNPFARALSNWKMFTNVPGRKRQLRSMGGDETADFFSFLKFCGQHKNHHWQPQSLYVPKRLDFLGRLENFSSDFAKVQSVALEFGLIEKRSQALHLNANASVTEHYSKYYGTKERELVEELYQVD